MITELTKKQKAMLPIYRDKWINIGLSCEPLDYDRAVDAVNRAYIAGELNPPQEIIVCDSPLGGVIVASSLKNGDSVGDSVRGSVGGSVWDSVGDSVRDSVWDSVRGSVRGSVWDSVGDSVRDSVWDSVRGSVGGSVGDSVYGSHDAHWLGFYDYFYRECGLEKEIAPLLPLIDLAHHCGWLVPYKNVCILQHRHSELHWDNEGRLHNDSGKAILYPDGWGVYLWHGRRIPEDRGWIIDNPENIELDNIVEEENVEIRRIMLEQISVEGVLGHANMLDEDTNNGVYLFQLPRDFGQATLSICPSTGQRYLEFLGNNNFETVQQAMNWQWDTEYDPDWQS